MESAIVICVLAETQRQKEEWKNSAVEKEKAPGVPWLEAVVWGSCRSMNYKLFVRGAYLAFSDWS